MLVDSSDTAMIYALEAEIESASSPTSSSLEVNLSKAPFRATPPPSAAERSSLDRSTPVDLTSTPPEVHPFSDLVRPLKFYALPQQDQIAPSQDPPTDDEGSLLLSLLDTGAMLSVFPYNRLPAGAKIVPLPTIRHVECAAIKDGSLTHYAVLMVETSPIRPATRISFHLADVKFPILCRKDMSRLGYDLSSPSLTPYDPNNGPLFDTSPTLVPQSFDEDSKELLEFLAPLLEINSKIVGPCTHPRALYTLRLAKRDISFSLAQFKTDNTTFNEMLEAVEKLVAEQVIEKVPSPDKTCMNLIPVRQGEKLRPCLNPTLINDHILPHPYDMSISVQDMLRAVAKSPIISHLDLKSAFHSCPVDEESSKYLVFRLGNQFYRYRRAPFGLSDLPAHFSQLMHEIIGDLEEVFFYIDDVIIGAQTMEEMKTRCARVISLFNKYNLKLNIDKCSFGVTKAKILGFIVSHNRIEADPDKLKIILALPKPTNITELRGFVSHANYIRSLVPAHGRLVQPLYEMLTLVYNNGVSLNRKSVVKWNDIGNQAFDDFKVALGKTISLSAMPDNAEPVLLCDASDKYYGAAVGFWGKDDKFIPVDVAHWHYKHYECHYMPVKKECLCLIRAVLHFHPYLFGRKFTICTDCKSLTFMKGGKTKDRTMQSWWAQLCGYNYHLRHITGTLENWLCDSISRTDPDLWPHPSKGVDSDPALVESMWQALNDIAKAATVDEEAFIFNLFTVNDTITNVTPSETHRPDLALRRSPRDRAARPGGRSSPSAAPDPAEYSLPHLADVAALAESLVNSPRADHDPSQSLPSAQPSSPPPVPLPTVTGDEDHSPLTLSRLPPGCELVDEPDERTQPLPDDTGHGSRDVMINHLLRAGKYWPGMHAQASLVTQNCIQCLGWNVGKFGFTKSLTVDARFPWEHVEIDLHGPMHYSSSSGNKYIVIMVDVLTGFIITKAIPNKESKTVAHAMLETFLTFGPPKIISSDNGAEFVSKLVTELKEQLAFSHETSASYNPRAQGKVERKGGATMSIIHKLAHQTGKEWDAILPTATFIMNTRIDSITHFSPFELMFYRLPPKLQSYLDAEPKSDALGWHAQLHQAHKTLLPLVQERKAAASITRASRFDQSHRVDKPWKSGQLVMIYNRRVNKGDAFWTGPYRVRRFNKKRCHYTLVDNEGTVLKRKVPHDQTKASGKVLGDNLYAIDYIVDSRETNGETQYRIRWLNYSSASDTWEPPENIYIKSYIKEFEEASAKFPGKKNAVLLSRAQSE